MKEKINEKKSLLREAEKMNEETLKKRRPRKEGVFGRLLTKFIIILVLLIILLGGGYFVFTKKFTPQVETKIVNLTSQLSLCQELVTTKYYYTDMIITPKKLGIMKSYVIIKYTGIIRAGIPDISKSDYEVYNEGKSLRIKLPDAEILGNDISSQETFDENQNMFIPVTFDEVFNAIEKAKEQKLEELFAEGILDEARNHAKQIVQQIMLAAGFEEVIVV